MEEEKNTNIEEIKEDLKDEIKEEVKEEIKEAIDKMTFKDGNEATKAIAITVIVPICVAIIGVLVWLKRRHA